MKLLAEKPEFKNSFYVFGALLLIIIALIWLTFSNCLSNEWLGIVSGLSTGFVVAFIQLLLSWREYQKMDKFDSFKITNILQKRNNKDYYKKMILSAESTIRVYGVTVQRFLNDFANLEETEPEGKELLCALGKGIDVRILIASECNLSNDEEKNKAKIALKHLTELESRFKNFRYSFYEHEPTHSIFSVDGESIIGPIFPGLSSEHTPAIHFQKNSKFAKHYLNYFKYEWQKWSTDKEMLSD